jgi:hypothetical protein
LLEWSYSALLPDSAQVVSSSDARTCLATASTPSQRRGAPSVRPGLRAGFSSTMSATKLPEIGRSGVSPALHQFANIGMRIPIQDFHPSLRTDIPEKMTVGRFVTSSEH